MTRLRLPLVSVLVLVLAAVLVRSFAPGPESERGPMKGPELIREYFRDLHDPYPANLDAATLARIWAEVQALPAQPALRSAARRSGGASPSAERGSGHPSAWQPYGPFGMDAAGGGKFSGRILDLELGPSGIRAVAAASGGLWIRDSGGWQARTDDLTTQWTGSFDTDPNDPNTILVGTGEPFIRAGTGLWKTTDGGDTWTRKPMSPEPATCFRIRYSADGSVIHGAFDLGYYRSTNGGETWTRRLNLGAWPTDMAIHPANPNILFLTLYGEGLFRSVNGGLNWAEVLGTGLPQSDLGRGALTICASDPNRMYVVWASQSSNNLLGTFRTDDGGVTWVNVSPPDDYLWGQGWYNNTVAVSPVDPDLVLAGGGGLIRTTDGGASWAVISSPGVHADCHASEWSPDGTEVFLGHDGGWSRSTDSGVSWNTDDNELPITQYVLVGASATEDPFVLGGGSQDNGISVTTDGGATWFFRHGGDGGGFSVDANDSNEMLSTAGIYGGAWPFRRLRSTDRGLTWTMMNSGIGTASQWFIRIRNDLGNPPEWYTYGDGFIYRRSTPSTWTSMNGNPTVFPHHVTELTASRFAEPNGTVYACLDSNIDGERLMVWNGAAFDERSGGIPDGLRIRKVPTHPRKADWAYALINGLGSPGQKVFRTTDRGVSWTNVTGNLPDVPVSDLVAHPTDDGRLFLGSEMGAFRTTDGGANWERWQLGLPEAAMMTEMTFVDRFDQTGEFFVVAGTYGRGVWVREVGSDDTSGLPGGSGGDGGDGAHGGSGGDGVPGGGAGGGRASGESGPVLHAGAPNPFRDGTSLSFTLETASRVSLTVHDVSGRELLRLLDEARSPGFHRAHLDGDVLGPGVYFVRLETAEGVATRRIVRVE